jgi:hypothetical protein
LESAGVSVFYMSAGTLLASGLKATATKLVIDPSYGDIQTTCQRNMIFKAPKSTEI